MVLMNRPGDTTCYAASKDRIVSSFCDDFQFTGESYRTMLPIEAFHASD